MKIAAIIANAAQLAIILAIFFVRGLDLGFLVIFLLFLLITVPFINVLALLFTRHPTLKVDESDAGEGAMIKRSAMRVRYRHGHGPILTVGKAAFAVYDLSEFGVRILASRSTPFKKRVTGTIQLKSGTMIDFRGTVMRRDDNEVVFQFADPIGTAVLMEENKAAKETNDE